MFNRRSVTIVVALLGLVLLRGAFLLRAQASVSLTGQVKSDEEGLMEGVAVSAKRAGSNITVTVVSNEKGLYSFPQNRLEAGQYSITVRAVGYDLASPATAMVSAQSPLNLDLKLRKLSDISSQLTNAEWLMSVPGTEQQKRGLGGCVSCHTLQRIFKSQHDADEFVQVMARMAAYAPGSNPLKPQRRVDQIDPINPDRFRKQAEWLAAVNLNSVSKWEYALKTLPRPTGRATRVIITEYDLPRKVAMPHDVILDPSGIAWYSDFGSQYLGKLDPKSGKVTEYPIPEFKSGFPQGSLDIEMDKDGNIWQGMMLQGAIVKFDPRTEKFQTFPLPPNINSNVAQQAMVMPASFSVDGKVWMNNVGIRGIHRLDLASGKFETFLPYQELGPGSGGGMDTGGHSVYGIAANSRNDLYFMDFGSENIGRVDARTGKIKLLPTPTGDSHPRRGHMDTQDRLWFAEYLGDTVAMLDTKTENFTEWPVPPKWTWPYDVVPDKNGDLWTGGMTTDRIVRLDPKTGQVVEYPLPRSTNVRRVFVDNSTTPVTFWVGNNNGASVIKLEPLD
jgi:virginiamycin B lyase